jgi:hypothetical protein
MAESQRHRLVLGRWRDNWPRWLLPTVLLVVLVGLVGLVKPAVLAWVVSRRWGLAWLVVACGIAVVGWLVFWAMVIPGRLAPPLSGPELAGVHDAKARLEAIDARTRLHHDLRNGPLQLLTVLAVFAGAVVGFQQLAEDRDQARQDRDQASTQLKEDHEKADRDRELTRQGQASERFTRAIDQLGSTRVETRIGGIYGLGQIAEQAPENTRPVGEVLLAWLNSRKREGEPSNKPLREHAPDVQAALTVFTGQQGYASIVRTYRNGARLDLHGLGLRGAELKDADLNGADLRGANLNSADLYAADLRDAHLQGADLTGADLGLTRGARSSGRDG